MRSVNGGFLSRDGTTVNGGFRKEAAPEPKRKDDSNG